MRLGLRKITLSGVMILLGTLAIMVAGCNAGGGGSTLDDAHQIIRLPLNANSTDINTMDPAVLGDFYSYFPVELVFPGLLTLDAAGNVQPWAASALPTYDQTTFTYTFTVRSGLKWSDGSPIDANTFAYSINRALNPCLKSPVTYYMAPIKDFGAYESATCGADGKTLTGKVTTLIGDSINVPDAQTLKITLGANAPYFLDAITYPTAFAQPKQLIDQYGNADWTKHLADGKGFGGNLFNVSKWDHKGNIDLVRNPSFWGTAPKLREVDFKIYKTVDAEYTDYLTGRLDQGGAPAAQYKKSKTRSDFHEQPVLNIAYFQPNWKDAPFDDVRVRQAFDLAINKQSVADNYLSGSVIPTNHIVPDGMPGYNASLTAPDGTQELTGNVAKATALMQAYAAAKCGGQMSKCTPVILDDNTDPTTEAVDTAVLAMWQAAFPGYPVSTHFEEFGNLLSQIYGGNPPQFYGIGWIADYPDAQDWLSLQFLPGAIGNFGNVNLPAATALMSQADTDLNPTSRISEYNQAEQALVTAGAWIPTFQGKNFFNLPTYVHNFIFTNQGTIPLTNWQTIYLTSH